MKIFLFFLLSGLCVGATAQTNPGKPTQKSHGLFQYDWLQAVRQLQVPHDTLNVVDSVNNIALIDSTLWGRVIVDGIREWVKIGGGGMDEIIDGGLISSQDFIGLDPGSNISVADFIRRVWYQSQPPTATISAGVSQELMAAGNPLTYTIAWTAGRQAKTATIASVRVAGALQSFSQPAAGTATSGTMQTTIQRNQTTQVQNLVTTTDGRTALAIATYSFFAQGYHGWVNSVAGIGTYGVYDDAVIRSLAFGAVSGKAYGSPTNSFDPGPRANAYFVYAYPAAFGDLQNFVINGLGSIDAMVKVQRLFTNASGFTQTYNFYYNAQLQAPTGAYPTYAY